MTATSNRVRHENLYFETVVFEVESTLFRVPRYGFVKWSEVFSTMFSLPTGDGGEEGLSDDNPIVLNTIDKTEFQSLLKIMYPFEMESPTFSQEEWIGVLNLATMWEFTKIRELAITALGTTSLSLVQKVLLAKKYKISNWLMSGYQEIVAMPEPLTVEAFGELDWETIAKLFFVREQFPPFERVQGLVDVALIPGTWVNCPYGHSSTVPARSTTISQKTKFSSADVSALLEKTFESELKGM